MMVTFVYTFSTRYVLVHMDIVLVCNFMYSMRSFFGVL